MRNPKPTQTFLVTWEIELDATSPFEAAKLAQDIQHDPDSLANHFTVRNIENKATHDVKLPRIKH